MTIKYKFWLIQCCNYFKVSETDMLDTRYKRTDHLARARLAFYCLCIRDGISIYDLSIELGKGKTTLINSVKHSKLDVKHHIKIILDETNRCCQ